MPRSLLGTRIRENRRSKGVSQAALAKQAGISASYLNLIEHNRRGIGGKTLLALARVLKVDPRSLSEGADQALVGRVEQAAALAPTIACEIDKTEEFIARFHGFARLIGRQFDRAKVQDETLQVMSDQMNSDPFFSEAMHLMLSNITTIKSTAEILSDEDGLPDDLKQRFLSNLLNEAERLAQTAIDVLQHFEPNTQSDVLSSDIAPAEAILESNDYYISQLEGNFISPVDYVAKLNLQKADEKEAVDVLARYSAVIQKLPIDTFLSFAKDCHYDPVSISRKLNVPLHTVMRRLAHLPKHDDIPRFGIMECDGSGAVIFRKQLPTLALPRFGSACPLWPIYRSFSQPLQPIKAFINTPTGERFLTYSLAQYADQNTVGLPARTTAIMVFTPDYEMFLKKPEIAAQPNLAVGLQCSVCPRDTCDARRAKYLLQ
jgi:predicted transcriptional regulator/transcriptional regulator with XRE-family HTH domain